MNIGQAAEASGLSADTIRFYEREGVLPPPPRRENGYREYTAEHVGVLRLACGLRELGLPLPDIGATVEVVHEGTCGYVRTAMVEMLWGTLHEIEQRIGQLDRTRDELTTLLGGLRAMRPVDQRVPEITACPCVEMVRGQ